MLRMVLVGAAVVAAVPWVSSPAAGQTAAQVIDSVAPRWELEQMARGEYPPMKREGALVGAIQRAWDDAPNGAGVYVARWAPNAVYKVRLREFMTTTIVLPQWETIERHVLGDSYGFKATQTQPHIMVVESAITGADTSLTIIGGSGRVYPFYIRSEAYNSPNLPDLVVRIEGGPPPADAAPKGAAGDSKADDKDRPRQLAAADKAADHKTARQASGLEDPDWLTEIPFDPAKLRFDFTMSGDKSIAPDRVFSDGVFTYFDYGDRWDGSDLPVVYRVVDGVDTPVNTRSRGTMLIAESAGAFTLRNGQRVVCVRPEGYVPDGTYRPLPKLGAKAAPSSVVEDRLYP